MSIIEVKGLFKIFGNDQKRVFPLLKKGLNKDEILKETGCTIGKRKEHPI